MPYLLEEAFDNAGDLLKLLAKAVKEDSDGGKKITISEAIAIFTEIGVKVVEDIND